MMNGKSALSCPAERLRGLRTAGRTAGCRRTALASRDDAITMAAEALCAGRIVAVKGLGGFHLMVDATNEAAVGELRRRKHREEKPLAVMFPSLVSLQAAAVLEADDERWLTSAAAPIVLVRRAESP